LLRIRIVPEGIDNRIDQQLSGEPDAGIAASDRHTGREIAAGAVTGDADAADVTAEFTDASDNVAKCGKGVLERAGKARFRRSAIGDGDDDRAGLDREPARLPVMGVEIAGDPAAAMEEHHGRHFPGREAIDPRGERTGGALHAHVFHGAHRRRQHLRARSRQRAKGVAGALRGHDFRIAQRQQRNDARDNGIERCGHVKTLVKTLMKTLGKRLRCLSSIGSPSGAGNQGVRHLALRGRHSRVWKALYILFANALPAGEQICDMSSL